MLKVGRWRGDRLQLSTACGLSQGNLAPSGRSCPCAIFLPSQVVQALRDRNSGKGVLLFDQLVGEGKLGPETTQSSW